MADPPSPAGSISARLADNPFPGLRAFAPDEASVFFGRQQQIDDLLRRLAEVPLIAVAGASGCGKSSLVLAGLLHALAKRHEEGDPVHWRAVVMRPGDAPITHLAAPLAVALATGDDDDATRVSALAGRLRLGADGLVQAVRMARLPKGKRVLVVVDQFEEIFRYKRMTDPEECAAFVKLLLQAAITPDCPLKVVLTLRSEALGNCADFRDLPEAVSRGQFLVPRMTREQRKQAIVGPVEQRDFQIAPRLVQLVLNDVSDDFDDLPVMQHALACTWRRWAADAKGSRPIDVADYKAVGGAEDALSQHADEAFDSLPGLDAVVERVFRALTERLDAAGSEVRRPMHFKRLCKVTRAEPAKVAAVVERYRRADTVFLLPTASTPLAPDTLIDIAHESLIRGWTKLKGWAEREALSAQTYHRIAVAAKPVEGKPAAFLRDPGLQFALDWRDLNRPNAHWAALYDPSYRQAMRFLKASAKARDDERAAVARASRNVTWAWRTVTAACFVASLAMAWLWQRSVEATAAAEQATLDAVTSKADLQVQKQQERDRGESRVLALAASRMLASGRMDGALVLGAGSLREPAADEAQEIMRKVLLEAPALVLRNDDIAKPSEPCAFRFNQLGFSPDGSRLAAASSRGDVLLWDVAQRQRLQATRHARGGLPDMQLRFAEGGDLLVSPDANGQAALGAEAGAALARPDAAATPAARSATATTAVTAAPAVPTAPSPLRDADAADALLDASANACSTGAGATLDAQRLRYARTEPGFGLRVWDLRSGALLASLGQVVDDATRVQFSPDGRMLAALSGAHVKVWNLAPDGAPQGPVKARVLPVRGAANALAFSPDSQFLAIADTTGAVVWGAHGTASSRRLPARGASVELLAFGADANSLAWGQSDGQVVIWDLGAAVARSSADRPHGNQGVTSLAFSSDGRQLASGDSDGVVALWAVTDQTLLQRLKVAADRVDRLAFSRDGTRLASAHRNGAVLLRELAGSAVRHGEFQAGLDAIATLAFDPDGTRLAMASDDSSVQFWDLAQGKVRQPPLRGHEFGLTSIAFSRDGALLASGSQDERIQVWDARSGAPLGAPLQDLGDQVNALAFSPDARLLAAAAGRMVSLWDLATRRRLWLHEQHAREALALAFSPDGTRLASVGREGTLVVVDAGTGQAHWKKAQPGVEIYAVAYRPDGSSLATGVSVRGAVGAAPGVAPGAASGAAPGATQVNDKGDRGAIQFWNVARGELEGAAIDVPGKTVRSIAFDRSGQRLVSGAEDGMVRLWNVQARKAIGQPFEGHDRVVTSVAFSPDGKTVASVAADLRIVLWDAEVQGWRRRACRIVPDKIKPEDWPRSLDATSHRRDTCAP